MKINIKKKLNDFDLNISFNLGNKPLALLGASGSGKSMILKCISGLENPDMGYIEKDGKILFDSRRNININPRDRKIGFIFQNYALFPHMTVYENIAFGLMNKKKDERDEIIFEKLKKVHLANFENKYPMELSGGQQQRVAIARALALEPEILLFDEPFSALDNYTRESVIGEIGEILGDFGGKSIFVTHNMNEAYELCEDIVVINKGIKECEGDKKSIFHSPPTYETAKITGCKNIVEVRQIDEETIYVSKWDAILTVNANKNIKYIGIRAHDIEISEERKENTISCKLEYVNEKPFEKILHFRAIDGKDKEFIKCIVGKNEKFQIKDISKIYNLHFPKLKIFTMSN